MDLVSLLNYVSKALEDRGIRYLVTGSVALAVYSDPRYTNDIDIVVELPPNMISDFCSAFPEQEFVCYKPSVEDAVRRKFQFNIINVSSGIKIDVIIANDSEFDRTRLNRGRKLLYAKDRSICFASPEDIILKKLIYYKEGKSEKHLRDISSISTSLGKEIDNEYLQSWATKLDVAAELKNALEKK